LAGNNPPRRKAKEQIHAQAYDAPLYEETQEAAAAGLLKRAYSVCPSTYKVATGPAGSSLLQRETLRLNTP